jgi:hypothetical protein
MENQQRSYEAFEKKHDMECTTLLAVHDKPGKIPLGRTRGSGARQRHGEAKDIMYPENWTGD